MTDSATSPLEDVYDLIKNQPPVELPAEFGADGSLRLTKFGRLDKLADWIAACQRREIPNIDTTTVALFAGSHGLAKYSVSMSEAGATERRVKALQEGKMATNGLAAQADATVRVFELALEVPTKDIAIEPAMSEQECASTIAFGMEAVTDKPDCLTLGMIGVGGGTAAAAVASALYGGDSQYWVRAGRGVPEEINLAREGIVNAAIKRHRGNLTNPLEILRRLGGRELAATVGAIIAARYQGIPVVLDGFATAVAAGVLHAIDPKAIDHVIAGQETDRPSHKAILERLDLKPLLELELQLGEGVGGILALGLLKSACVISAGRHGQSAT